MAASLQGFLGFFCFTAHLSTAKRRGKESTLLNQPRYCTGLADCGRKASHGNHGDHRRGGTSGNNNVHNAWV